MTHIRFAAIAALACLASGCNTAPKDIPIYQGLLPDGYQVKTSDAPLDRAAMKTKKLALIPSENFNAYAATWSKAYEKNNAQAFMGGTIFGSAETFAGQRNASDPRTIGDLVVNTLRPHFGSVTSAADLPSAKAAGAEYFAILDYRGFYNEMGDHYIGDAQVNILDSQLVQIAAIPAKSDTYVKGAGLFDLSGLVSLDVYGPMQEAMATTNANVATQIRAGLAARFGQ